MRPRSRAAAVLGLDECGEKPGSVWIPGTTRSNNSTAGSARCFWGYNAWEPQPSRFCSQTH
jgi:hypothetical protein